MVSFGVFNIKGEGISTILYYDCYFHYYTYVIITNIIIIIIIIKIKGNRITTIIYCY